MSLCNFLLVDYQLQIIFVHVEMDDEDVGKPIADYFGITGHAPKVIFCFLHLVLLNFIPMTSLDIEKLWHFDVCFQ